MLAQLGFIALSLAFVLAIMQVLFGLLAIYKRNEVLRSIGYKCVYWQFTFVFLSIVLLAFAFLFNDFSILYVFNNSNKLLPWYYKLCAVWGAHEGSMLLWVTLLALWSVLVSRQTVTSTRVVVILGVVSIAFYLFLLLTSNPFLLNQAIVNINGRDLNPLLQDPGFVSHPPILYFGYVGMSVPFAFALAYLWNNERKLDWIKSLRTWTCLAWSFLTFGIVLGSWWAYRELGWGGWWFWDPVENAAFMPWLASTALVHALIIADKRQYISHWTVLLSIVTFALSLIGTFMVRSGILISVHAFALDPSRGTFIFNLLIFLVGGALLLYALKGRKLSIKHPPSILFKERILLLNNIFLFVALLTILLGTLYPLLYEELGWGKLSVGAPYFDAVFAPIMIPVIFLMGLVPFITWEENQLNKYLKPLIAIFIVSVLFALTVPLFFSAKQYPVILGLFLACWLLLTTLYRRKFKAVTWAHLGIAVTLMGIIFAHNYSIEHDVRLKVGESTSLGPYHFTLKNINQKIADNYLALEAIMPVTYHNKVLSTLNPQFRLYKASHNTLTKTAMDISWRRDLYVALGRPFADGSWPVRVYFKPFVRWIWVGGLLMVLGGLIGTFRRNTS